MVVADSTRRRAKLGDGVLGASVLGGFGMAGLGDHLSVVMKFGGSSVASAARMAEVAGLILTFPEERPVVVLSAMGKTTNNLLLAGEKAVGCGVIHVSEIEEWNMIKDLHIKTVDELGLPRSAVQDMLDELEQLLKGIAMMKELTPRTCDYLVSFGECMSTRIFVAYLNKIGFKARQYDAFDIGFMTTDEFGNADILEATYPAVAKRLHGDWIQDPAVPVVTGFLGKGWKSGAVTTLGRGGSDLTATTIGKALGLREIQVWKDVDGVLTCDPNIYPHAKTVPFLTFEEATELAYFGAQELDNVVEELEKIAIVHLLQQRAIISLIGNVRQMSLILEKTGHVLRKSGVNVQMISQGASKVNMSLIVHDSEAKALVEALHQAFFQDDVLAQDEAENLLVG